MGLYKTNKRQHEKAKKRKHRVCFLVKIQSSPVGKLKKASPRCCVRICYALATAESLFLFFPLRALIIYSKDIIFRPTFFLSDAFCVFFLQTTVFSATMPPLWRRKPKGCIKKRKPLGVERLQAESEHLSVIGFPTNY